MGALLRVERNAAMEIRSSFRPKMAVRCCTHTIIRTSSRLVTGYPAAMSSKAKEMDQLSGTIEESRTERFNKVQRALESGTYHVSARDIARKLIDANQK